jgi:hypothetical protein
MIFLKNILGARVAHNSLARFFSAKKSSEQLAYYQQRIESLPNFSIKFVIKPTFPSGPPLRSSIYSTNTPKYNNTPTHNQTLRSYADVSPP